jgi:hypothetical protein
MAATSQRQGLSGCLSNGERRSKQLTNFVIRSRGVGPVSVCVAVFGRCSSSSMGECPFSRLRSSAIVMCDQQPIRSVLRDHAAGSKKRNLKRIAFIRICVCRCSFPDKRCILVTVHKSYWHGRLVQFVTGTFQF